MKWSIEEKEELQRICFNGWDFHFPGYKWVSIKLNSVFDNNRSAIACRRMDIKLNKKG